jgi:hypothetical protein
MITIVGDSHLYEFLPHKQLGIFYLGPRTAYQLQNHHELHAKQVFPILKKSGVVFFLGEIDCRIHIYNKARKNSTSISNGIEKTVTKYVEYLKRVKDEFELDLAVMSIVPTGAQHNVYNYEYYADYTTQKFITMSFNVALEYYSNLYRIKYINIFKMLVDNNNDRLATAVKDVCHCYYSTEIVSEILKVFEQQQQEGTPIRMRVT